MPFFCNLGSIRLTVPNEIFENTHEAIIDQETFDNVQHIRANVKRYPDGSDEAAAQNLVKKIGKTTYKVRVHFSTTSTETMSDKIKRMLKNEVQQI